MLPPILDAIMTPTYDFKACFKNAKKHQNTPNTYFCAQMETSLLRRLQGQTLPDATPPVGKIYPFTKMAVTFEPVMQF